MKNRIRSAEKKDLDILVDLMGEFYNESGFKLDKTRSRDAFKHLISNSSLGNVWLFEEEDTPVGYMVLTLCFSMEYGGKDAFLDDLFIKNKYRGAGLGKKALKMFFETCKKLDVCAVHVEVGRSNIEAKGLYKRFGFKDNDRLLLTSRLKDPL